MAAQKPVDSGQIAPGAPQRGYVRGRGFAYQVAMAVCLVLIGCCGVFAVWSGSGMARSSGLALLGLLVFPGLFPASFLGLVCYGYWLDYQSEKANGIVAPRFQFNISHLLWLVVTVAILSASFVFLLRALIESG
jgi:hypothetical protein